MRTLFLFAFLSLFSGALSAQDFLLHSNSVTVICDDAAVGDSGSVTINGVATSFTKRERFDITGENAATTCTSGITDMSEMFIYQGTFNADISHWDVSSVTAMSTMFAYTAINQDLSNWDVSAVTNMAFMFQGASAFNSNIGSWDVANVTDMGGMLTEAIAFNADLSGWDVSSVTNMNSMFAYADVFNQDISGWDVSAVTDMGYMFASAAAFNQDLSGWCVSGISAEPGFFAEWSGLSAGNKPVWGSCPEPDNGQNDDFYFSQNGLTVICENAAVGETGVLTLNGVAVNFTKRTKGQITPDNAASTCTSGITDMSELFKDQAAFNGDISHWDVSSVSSMRSMFSGAAQFNGAIGSWQLSGASQLDFMFNGAAAFNQDISGWDVSGAIDMSVMFDGASSFSQDLSGWDVRQFASAPNRFADNSAMQPAQLPIWGTKGGFTLINAGKTVVCEQAPAGATQQLSVNGQQLSLTKRTKDQIIPANAANSCTSGITDMSELFAQATSFVGDISHWDMRSVTTMRRMFFLALAFNGDLSAWDVSQVTDMSGLFEQARAFNQGLANWDLSAVTTSSRMFAGAQAFNGDISGWNVAKVADMSGMFAAAAAFNGDLSGWDVGQVISMGEMFQDATSFNSDISGWSIDNVTDMNRMFAGAAAFSQDLSRWVLPNISAQPQNFASGSGLQPGQLPTWGSVFLVAGNGLTIICPDAPIGASQAISYKGQQVRFTRRTKNQITPENAETSCTTGITDMAALFKDQVNFNGDISHWDVSAVSSMSQLFWGASAFNGNISGWDVANVADMSGLFLDATSFNQPLNDWDVSGVGSMNSMFTRAAAFNQELSAWDVSAVTDMNNMFNTAAAFSQDLSLWVLPNISAQPQNFASGSGLLPEQLPFWGSQFSVGPNGATVVCENAAIGASQTIDYNGQSITFTKRSKQQITPENAAITCVSGLTDLSAVFKAQNSFNADISHWDVASVTNMSELFSNAQSFNQNLSNWNVSSVSNMGLMFASAVTFNGNIAAWNVSSVTDMSFMFSNASEFNADLSDWDVSSVTNMNSMFQNATKFNQDLSDWDVVNIPTEPTDFSKDSGLERSQMPSWSGQNKDFYIADNGITVVCESAEVGETGLLTIKGISTNFTKRSKEQITPENAATSCTSGITDMSFIFSRQLGFSADISHWDVASVSTMQGMFEEIGASFNRDLSVWDVANVINMESMFAGASGFTQDLSGWCVSQIEQEPANFATRTNMSVENYPVWGSCNGFSWAQNGQTLVCADVELGQKAKLMYKDQLTTFTKRNIGQINTENAANSCISGQTDLSALFQNEVNFNGDINHWDVALVTNMANLFEGATSFNQPLSSWNVGNKLTNMQSMFSNASSFNQDLQRWDVSSVTNMSGMFSQATTFNQPIGNWQVGAVSNMDAMFQDASAFSQDLSSWQVSQIPTAPTNFAAGSALLQAQIPLWGTNIIFRIAQNGFTVICDDANIGDSATIIYRGELRTFTKRENSLSLRENPESSCTSGITDMSDLFNADILLRTLSPDVAHWDVSAVKNMARMFKGAFSSTRDVPQADLFSWDVSSVTNMTEMFADAQKFRADLSNWDVSNVKDMTAMFSLARQFNGDIANWNVGNVTDMKNLFFGATLFNQNIAAWNVSKVTNMSSMFLGASAFDQNIAAWNVLNVTSMQSMFNGATAFDQNISIWDVSNVTTMLRMFNNSVAFNQDISGWDVSSVTDMSSMFYGASLFNQNLNSWCVLNMLSEPNSFALESGLSLANQPIWGSCWSGMSYADNGNTIVCDEVEVGDSGVFVIDGVQREITKRTTEQITIDNASSSCTTGITTINSLFQDQSSFNGDIRHWDVSAFENMASMFSGAPNFNQELSSWNVEGVNDMRNMFKGATAFNGNISIWNVDNVTDVTGMFDGAASFNQELGSWNVTQVTAMQNIFKDAAAFNGDISSWEVDNITNMNSMFEGATSFNQDLSSWNVESVTSMQNLFKGAAAFNGDISGWKVDKITDMSSMFDGATSFNQDLSTWNVESVPNMQNLFKGAAAFNGDISSWKVDNVTDMSSMFEGAASFNQELGSWSVSKVTSMQNMFKGATVFNRDISNWKVNSITNMESMFENAVSFNQDIGAWEVESVSDMNAMFNGATQFNQDLSQWCSPIVNEPVNFSTNSRLGVSNLPKWNCNNGFYVAENGVTVVCDLANYRDEATIMYQGRLRKFIKEANIKISMRGGGIFTIKDYYDFFEETCTSGITDMKDLFHITDTNFRGVLEFGRLDIGHWDVSNVTNMSFMFSNQTWMVLDLSAWDVSNVVNMAYMFKGVRRDKPGISTWDVGKVRSMQKMFFQAYEFNDDLSSWDVSSVTDMNGMFEQSHFNRDISSWDVGNVRNMSTMFKNNAFFSPNKSWDLSKWNVSSVQYMKEMFSYTAIRGGIADWDVSNVTDMSGMFHGAKVFVDDISRWDITKVRYMKDMFKRASSFNADLSSWDTSKVKELDRMFEKAEKFNNGVPKTPAEWWDEINIFNKIKPDQDVDLVENTMSWDLSSAESVSGIFADAAAFDADISNWNLSNAKQLDDVRAAGDTLWYYQSERVELEQILSENEILFADTDSAQIIVFGLTRDSLDFRVLTQDTLLAGFLQNTGMSTENLDKLVVSLSQQTLQPTVTSITTYPAQVSEQGAAALEQLSQSTGVQVTTGGVRTQVALNQSLKAGWNLISLPVQQVNTALSTLFPWADPNLIYGYNGSYIPVDSLVAGLGYWVYSEQPRELDWDDYSHPPMVRRVAVGWNLLGSSSFELPINELIDPSNLLDKDAALSHQDTGYEPLSEVQPGQGYWISSSGPGQIDIPFNVPGQQGSAGNSMTQKFSQPSLVNELGGLRLNLRQGAASLPLQVGFAEPAELAQQTALQDRPLPPAPPQGGFDGRLRIQGSDYRTKVLGLGQQLYRFPISYQVAGTDSSLQFSWNPNELVQDWEYSFESPAGAQVYSVNLADLGGSWSPTQVQASLADSLVLVIKERVSTSIDGAGELPLAFNLAQNYPNPFNPTTTISFTLAQANRTSLKVYNMQGQLVSTLLSQPMNAGKHHISFDASGLPTGVYMYKLQSGAFRQVQKMTLVK